jgi:hypothetical protein
MSTDNLIESLAGDLKPVRPRAPAREAGLLALVCVLELAGFLALGMARPDLAEAARQPVLWWKFGALGLLALAGFATALRSFSPQSSARPGLIAMLAVAVISLVLGWGFDTTHRETGDLLTRLNPADGLRCLGYVLGLSLPPLVLLGVLMRRAAATDPQRSAAAVGLGSAAFAAWVFVFACPHDDPLYVVFWYALACSVIAYATYAILPRLTRW